MVTLGSSCFIVGGTTTYASYTHSEHPTPNRKTALAQQSQAETEQPNKVTKTLARQTKKTGSDVMCCNAPILYLRTTTTLTKRKPYDLELYDENFCACPTEYRMNGRDQPPKAVHTRSKHRTIPPRTTVFVRHSDLVYGPLGY